MAALRPHRASGVVVKAERLDEKTVTHSYGHGGSRLSLSWRTSHPATQLALDQTERSRAAGIVGLTSARVLHGRGFEVSIYASVLPPDTTSTKLWVGFTPTSSLVSRHTAAWKESAEREAGLEP